MGPKLTVFIIEVSLFQSVHNSRFDCTCMAGNITGNYVWLIDKKHDRLYYILVISAINISLSLRLLADFILLI